MPKRGWLPPSMRRLKIKIANIQNGHLDKQKRLMFFRRLAMRVAAGKIAPHEAEQRGRNWYHDATPKEIAMIWDAVQETDDPKL